MRIDLRVLIPFAAPFVLLLTARLVWWVAGARWTEVGAAGAALFSLIFGLIIGGCVAGFMWEADVKIGYLNIGKAKRDD